jgi:uncharacterized NAD(P)/FAD-binding protein YdhS
VTTSAPVVAVIGAGFSGLMTAMNLLRAPPDNLKVILIERRSTIGLGAAYATADPCHRLNVRAGNMSAWPDRPEDFVTWLKAREILIGPDGFATRGEYGRYLQSLLLSQLPQAGASSRLSIVHAEITAIEAVGAGWTLTRTTGSAIMADAVILALGNARPHRPDAVDPELECSPAYIADPWRWDSRKLLDGHGPILMLGTGLTMVDMALSLARVAPDRPMIALSRRGLTPRDHDGAAFQSLPAPPASSLSPVEALAWLREAAARHGWRTAVDAVRPVTQALWRNWTLKERAGFLRHARVLWDTHRHRLSPKVAERFAQMLADGSLRIIAGKLEHARLAHGGGLEVTWRPRGKLETEHLSADLMVNCTGPSMNIEQSSEPVIVDMISRGLIRADPLRMGLDIVDGYRVARADGRPEMTLLAVGPPTQGALWEISAVPDIRIQAAEVAAAALKAVRVSFRRYDGASN